MIVTAVHTKRLYVMVLNFAGAISTLRRESDNIMAAIRSKMTDGRHLENKYFKILIKI